eukprot:scaffold581711_cov15-Prasinocladus_malaysianus.AAC.1
MAPAGCFDVEAAADRSSGTSIGAICFQQHLNKLIMGAVVSWTADVEDQECGNSHVSLESMCCPGHRTTTYTSSAGCLGMTQLLCLGIII